MRDKILDFLAAQDLGTFTLSTQMPYDSSGIALYLKNTKTVYVNKDQVQTTEFMGILGADSIDMDINTVTIFVACDAKVIPADYDQIVSTIKSAKALYSTNGFFKREVDVKTDYVNDLLTTEVEIRYYKLAN
jgi:hypothetical protein